MTDREKALAFLLAMGIVAVVLKDRAEQTPPAIHPTMRPDPQAVSLSHGTLIQHASA